MEPVTPVELLCLGSSLALSGLCYYLYRRKAAVAARVQEAPKLPVGEELPALVSAAPGSCLPYVALEGVVLPAKAALCSQYHGGMQGVIQKLLLKEHRLVWNSLARSWTESERVLSEQVYTVPFLLASPDAEVATQNPSHEKVQAASPAKAGTKAAPGCWGGGTAAPFLRPRSRRGAARCGARHKGNGAAEPSQNNPTCPSPGPLQPTLSCGILQPRAQSTE
uniref:MUL1A ligase n=1 Tax=Cairina moschata TaxID=8855 RepID=A0A8C3BCQ0_CAIMO